MTPYSFTWVVNPSLNDIIHRTATRSLFLPQLGIQVQRQHFSHMIVVGAQVWILVLHRELGLQEVVAV